MFQSPAVYRRGLAQSFMMRCLRGAGCAAEHPRVKEAVQKVDADRLI